MRTCARGVPFGGFVDIAWQLVGEIPQTRIWGVWTRVFKPNQCTTKHTFSKCRKQNAVVVRLLLLAEADENGVLDVTSYVGQHLNSGVHFALEETEERVTDVLNSALHWRQRLQTTECYRLLIIIRPTLLRIVCTAGEMLLQTFYIQHMVLHTGLLFCSCDNSELD